jgi:hypothetical protein
MKIRIKNIPEGYEIRNKKLVKTMATGGSVTKSTLQPVDRDEANVEAEKNETVLTDMDQDGFFELYNVGGKRHSNGGTPLNLPEQSFIYSDTRKMKFTKDEMKELGITSKKRLTPAAVSKKFPVNKYMDILKDESSDEIAITTAEAMIKKNKIKLSHIAFLQEKKKNFEDGLPLAAYPFLLENGVDPKEFEAKLEQKKQQEQQAQAPQGPAGGQGQPSPQEMEQMAMAMAMQQQGQGMPPQGAPQGMPPQGPPMQGPPQGIPPGMPPQGMMPPMGMAMGGMELKDFIYGTGGGIDNPGFTALPLEAQQNIINNMQDGGQPVITDERVSDDFQTINKMVIDNGDTTTTSRPNPFAAKNAAIDCETTLCEYEQWLAQYRLKDIPEVRFMYESYKTRAIDKMKAPEIDTRIMPGHENLKNMPYGNMPGTPPVGSLPGWKETLKGFIPDVIEPYIPFLQEGGEFKPHMMYNPETEEGFIANTYEDHMQMKEMGFFHQEEMQEGGQPMMDGQSQMSEQEMMLMQLAQAKKELTLKKQQVISQFSSNPEAQNNPEAEAYLQNILLQIDQQIFDIESRMQLSQEKEMLNKTTLNLSDFIGETVSPQTSNDSYEYFNPDRLMRRGGSIGRSIPRFDNGGEDDGMPVETTFNYQGTDNNGYPVSLNPYYRTSPTRQYIDGVENPNYDANFESSIDNGISSHEQFYEIMSSPRFSKVRDEWLQQYKDLDVAGKIDTDDETKLFKAFNDMNILLNAAFSSGLEFKDKTNISKQLETVANKLGMEIPTDETIKMYQGMYNSLASAKLLGTDETKNLLEQVNVNFGDKPGGAYEIVPNSGQYVSNIDGLIGDTTSKQFVSVNDNEEVITTDIEEACDEETKRLKIQECMEKGMQFNAKTCECHKKPTTTPTGKIPPYLTFPGDDLKVGALASIHRDKKYGILQNYDPIMRDPGYVDDRAQVAATTALANQAMELGNVSDVQGRAQDQIDKIQANRWGTNTKIFDNTQAYNVAEINKARELNSGYMQDYQDMVNKVDQEYDNTKIADMMNLVDAETTRMDNADKLHELNLKNPNYYFDPQRHRTIFQNPQALEAFRGNPNAEPISMADAINECKTQYGIVDEGELLRCAEMRMGVSNTSANVDYTRGDVNVDNDDGNTEESRYGGSYKYGGTIKERDLKNSSNKLRKWIMGIE